MIKAHIDIATTRRLVGWVYRESTPDQRPDVRISDGHNPVRIDFVARPDVAQAFGLPHEHVGFDVVVPDCFDAAVNDFTLLVDGQPVFGLAASTAALDSSAAWTDPQAAQAAAFAPPDYGHGRHVVFLHSGACGLARALATCAQAAHHALFPPTIAGVTFSGITIARLGESKAALIANARNVILVCPSALYEGLNAVSPALLQEGRLVTLYAGASLTSQLGLHEHQLNHFFAGKRTGPLPGDAHMAAVLTVRRVVEHYAEALFPADERMFFLATEAQAVDRELAAFARDHVQGVRKEGLVRLVRGDQELLLVNFAAYTTLHDVIGTQHVWRTAVRRGLARYSLELQ
jgi:hypothetical protein